MRGFLTLLATLVLGLGILSGAFAHGAEVAGNPEIASFSNGLHVAGDADEVKGDADQAMPHHHNACHGHDVAAPFSQDKSACLPAIDQPAVSWPVSFLAETPQLGLLRPPKP